MRFCAWHISSNIYAKRGKKKRPHKKKCILVEKQKDLFLSPLFILASQFANCSFSFSSFFILCGGWDKRRFVFHLHSFSFFFCICFLFFFLSLGFNTFSLLQKCFSTQKKQTDCLQKWCTVWLLLCLWAFCNALLSYTRLLKYSNRW